MALFANDEFDTTNIQQFCPSLIISNLTLNWYFFWKVTGNTKTHLLLVAQRKISETLRFKLKAQVYLSRLHQFNQRILFVTQPCLLCVTILAVLVVCLFKRLIASKECVRSFKPADSRKHYHITQSAKTIHMPGLSLKWSLVERIKLLQDDDHGFEYRHLDLEWMDRLMAYLVL